MDSIVFRGDKVIVPESPTADLVSNTHEAHPGTVKTKQRLEDKFWWPRMDRQFEHAVRSCHLCPAADKPAKPAVASLQLLAFP